MKEYFKSDFFKITYLEDVNIIVNTWLTAPTSEEFREGAENLLKAMQYFKTGKLVSDVTNIGALLLADQEWVATDWYERAAKEGFSHNAIIVPHDIFTELSVEGTLYNVDLRLVRSYFDTQEEAIAWIKQF